MKRHSFNKKTASKAVTKRNLMPQYDHEWRVRNTSNAGKANAIGAKRDKLGHFIKRK